MNSIKNLFLVLIFFNLIYLSVNQHLNGKCGYPGKPYRAKLEPDNKLQYNEGEEVTYQCTDFWSNVLTRKCEKGKWTGSQPRCGDFVTGILMKDSKLEDISDPDNPIEIFEHLNMKLVNRTWKYPNVFTSHRFPTARLRVFDTKKYKWSFKFTGPAVKLFVRINFNFINYTFLPQEVRDNFVMNISLYVSPHRKCVLLYQTDDIWRENGRKTDSDFICDSLSYNDFKRDVTNPGDYLIMETQTSVNITHDLIAIFFGKSYGTEEEPLCGEPEIMINQYSKFSAQYKDYQVDCKREYKYTSPSNDVLPETSVHGFKCAYDMKWNGSYPICMPRKPCPLNELQIGKQSNNTVITSYDGLYIFNDSVYYAVEGTEVNYGCIDPTSDILVGKENRICQKTGLWTLPEPYCYNPNVPKFPVWLLIITLFFILIFILCITGSLFYIYTKRIKKRFANQTRKENRVESERYDTYDDIDFPGGNKLYDTTYDVVGDGEVRYADPYYNTEVDYVEMPANVQVQSSNSYWRLPQKEPAYLEMTCSTKNSPNSSLTKINDQVYKYQL